MLGASGTFHEGLRSALPLSSRSTFPNICHWNDEDPTTSAGAALVPSLCPVSLLADSHTPNGVHLSSFL